MAKPLPVTVVELTAVRVRSSDADVGDALERVWDLEGQPVDDSTWDSMVVLAQKLAAEGSGAQLKEDRKWGSVQASAGPAMVDVRWQGEAAHIYFTTQPGSEQDFHSLVRRLQSEGFTVVHGYAMTAVTPASDLADIVARQEAEERGE